MFYRVIFLNFLKNVLSDIHSTYKIIFLILRFAGDCVGFFSEPEHPLVFAWSHLHCDEKHSFLCEVDAEHKKETETTTSTSTETTLQPLECPSGYNWKSHDISGYCFWVRIKIKHIALS